jgi:hypothetical protein
MLVQLGVRSCKRLHNVTCSAMRFVMKLAIELYLAGAMTKHGVEFAIA